MEFIYIIGGIIVFLFILLFFVSNSNGKSSNDSINRVKESIENNVKDKENYKISLNNNRNYDIFLELNETIYLIKVICISKEHEIVITNKTTWIINNRKSTPNIKNRITGIKEFIEYRLETNKLVKKVAILYPSAYKVLKYINENEMVIVNPKIDVHGCKIIQFNNNSDIEYI
ncbi:MAG: hypothetical protein K0Q49_2316 [Haloplasmataceae bacterium]|jgi:hypothetical protein|nr:hypothetical protein [Haloplasmataceae bacterium]